MKAVVDRGVEAKVLLEDACLTELNKSCEISLRSPKSCIARNERIPQTWDILKTLLVPTFNDFVRML